MRSPLRAIDRTLRPDGHVFYGWWIVLAGGGVQMLIGALLMQAFGAYVVLLRDDFGWSLAALPGAFAIARLAGGLLGPLPGWAVAHLVPGAGVRVGGAPNPPSSPLTPLPAMLWRRARGGPIPTTT